MPKLPENYGKGKLNKNWGSESANSPVKKERTERPKPNQISDTVTQPKEPTAPLFYSEEEIKAKANEVIDAVDREINKAVDFIKSGIEFTGEKVSSCENSIKDKTKDKYAKVEAFHNKKSTDESSKKSTAKSSKDKNKKSMPNTKIVILAIVIVLFVAAAALYVFFVIGVDNGKTNDESADTLPSTSQTDESTEASSSEISDKEELDESAESESHSLFEPYLVKVYPTVYIYDGPSCSYDVVSTIDEEGVYTIVEESEEKWKGTTKLWGRLKSGVGWICIDDAIANVSSAGSMSDYMGFWYADENYERELEIYYTSDNAVCFTLYYYRLTGLDNIKAELNGNVAYFKDNYSNTEGYLKFENSSIIVGITYSETIYLELGEIVYTERFNDSQLNSLYGLSLYEEPEPNTWCPVCETGGYTTGIGNWGLACPKCRCRYLPTCSECGDKKASLILSGPNAKYICNVCGVEGHDPWSEDAY